MNDFDNRFTLQLFHLSDQEANTTSTELAPNLSAILNALRAEDIDGDGEEGFVHTLVLSSGDAWIPGLFYDASEAIWGARGAADILIQNELGVQAIAFGNHEFDNGTGIIAELVSGEIDFGDADPSGFLPFAGANFPYLSGNLGFDTDPNLAPLATADGQNVADIPGQLSGSALVTTSGGETIGLVAATVPTIEDGLSSPGPDLTVLPGSNALADLAVLIQEDVDALLAANPDLDKIILLSHQQVLGREQELATLLTGVDIIVAGGSNTILLDENDPGFGGEAAQGAYPGFFTAADGAPVAVVNTDAAYQYLGRLVIDFDENGEIIPESYDPELSGAFETSDEGVARVGAEGLADPGIVEIAELVEAEVVAGEGNFFAVSDVFLNGERQGGGTDGVRTQETNLGNLTADANLWYAERLTGEDVLVSFKNGGGIRANIGRIVQPAGDAEPERLPPEGVPGAKPEGGISENDVGNALAFNNGLTLLDLTTEQLLATVEGTLENWTSLETDGGGFGQFGGLRFSFDPDREPGDRVVNAAVVDEETGEVLAALKRDGEVVDNGDQTFRTVTLNFLANGGAGGLPVTNPDEEGFDPAIAAATNRTELYKDEDGDLAPDEDAPSTGGATFAIDGSEQDALAEYLLAEFGAEGETRVAIEDTPPEGDERIQNLAFREDAVFAGGGEDGPGTEIKVATFNASLNRAAEGELIADLSTPDDAQARNVAQVIQRSNPDVLLVNEFDFDAEGEAARLFQENYLSVGQGGEAPVEYPYVYVAPSNTGVDSGLDLDGNGEATGTGNDAFGFGAFPGQFAFVIFSKYEIDEPGIRTFQEFLWKDMPGNLLTDENTEGTQPLTELLSREAVDAFRLSSKNHVDVPVLVDGETVHILAAHPTPPVFDNPAFDLNGKRNFDEIRFWADYVAGEDYIVDDAGESGGLGEGERFVIVGDYNSDPFDGDSVPGAARQIVESPLVIGSATDDGITPDGLGSLDQPGGFNAAHEGDPRFDTADFGFNQANPAEDVTPGNLRVDYVLPSVAGLTYLDGAVVWPAADDPFADVTDFPTSDHRLVEVTLAVHDAETAGFGEDATLDVPSLAIGERVGDVTLDRRDGAFTLETADADGTITLDGTDTLFFTDARAVLSGEAQPGEVAEFYEIALDRFYDMPGLSFWYGLVEAGTLTLDEVGQFFAVAPEFEATNGAGLGDDAFVDALIANSEVPALDGEARDAFVAGLGSGELERGDVVTAIAASAEFDEARADVTADGVFLFV